MWEQVASFASLVQTTVGEFVSSVDLGSPTDYLPGGRFWPVVRTTVLILAIVVTLLAILWLYGGNLQNANIGPISIRSRTATGNTFFKAPRSIVTSALEGKTVRCTFYLSYMDRRGKSKLVRLARKVRFRFKLSALNKRLSFTRADMFGFWNPRFERALQDAFVESGIPAGPEDTGFFSIGTPSDQQLDQKQSDDTEIVALSTPLWEALTTSHLDFIRAGMKRFQRFLARRRRKDRFSRAGQYLDLPDYAQDANLYMRMHFSANPLGHPDSQVKTTAWLTLLTSLFALLTQWLYVGF